MNVFQRYTLRSLRRNRMRTLVTLIGVTLSMALFTAVLEGAQSGLSFLKQAEIDRTGAYHGLYYGLDGETAARAATDAMDRVSYLRTVGFAPSESVDPVKPYVAVAAADEAFFDLVTVKLSAGRLPENGSELILSEETAAALPGNVGVGSALTLSLGRRLAADGRALSLSDGLEFSDDGSGAEALSETLAGGESRTFTVVGLWSRLNLPLMTDGGSPAFLCLTRGDAPETDVSVLFTMKDPARFFPYFDQNAVSERLMPHRDLLMFFGGVRNRNLQSMLYGFAAVLVALIVFGSISLIYNAFSISVSERTRQFGILKSVGATRRQIRGTVLFEALVLGAAGILLGAVVGCVGLGVTLWALGDAFSYLANTPLRIHLVLSPGALGGAAAICLATTLIAAWIPAGRALRISPIEAIRQTRDIRIRPRDVRTRMLTSRLFGFEGMMAAKNFKRNRKRYRATVLSLFLSVTLFISASSFCAYLRASMDGVADPNAADLYVSLSGAEDADQLLSRLAAAPTVDKRACARYSYLARLQVDESALSADAREQSFFSQDLSADAIVCLVDDETFRTVCRSNGLDAEALLSAPAIAGPVFGQIAVRLSAPGGTRWRSFDLFRSGAAPMAAALLSARPPEEGYLLFDIVPGPDGELRYRYLREDYALELWRGEPPYDVDPDRAVLLTEEEQTVRTPVTLAPADVRPFFGVANDRPTVFLPASRAGELPMAFDLAEFFFTASDHAAAAEAMRAVLDELGPDELGRPSYLLQDLREISNGERLLLDVINVFSYGFITLISLIAVANVFNTVSTGIFLRRREFAMLRSVGMSRRSFRRMMDYECVIYGLRGLLFGLPAAGAVTYLLYRIVGQAVEMRFFIPWQSVVIAVGSVFAVVFATMLYSTAKIRRDNPVEALKTETL